MIGLKHSRPLEGGVPERVAPKPPESITAHAPEALRDRVAAAEGQIAGALAERHRLNQSLGELHKAELEARAKYRETPSDENWKLVADLVLAQSRAREDIAIADQHKAEAEQALEQAQTALAQREVERLAELVPHPVVVRRMVPTIQRLVDVQREAAKLVAMLQREAAVNACTHDALDKARQGAHIAVMVQDCRPEADRPIELERVRQLVGVALHRAEARSLADWLTPGDPQSPEYTAAAALLDTALPGAQ